MKILLNIIGITAVALALLGAFLPLLPTTPFLLLASACFARSSPRLNHWLLNNPLFGKYLKSFQDHKAIPVRGKVTILVLLWVSLAFSIYTVHSLLAKGLLLSIGIAVTLWILHFKTLQPDTTENQA